MMDATPLKRYISAWLAFSVVLSACEVDFTPRVATLEIPTAPPQPFQTPGVGGSGTVSPLPSGSPGPDLQLTLQAIEANLAENRNGDPEELYYEEVLCPSADIEARCYRLCVRGECEVFPNDAEHSRVQSFINSVDKIAGEQEKIEDAGFRDASFSLSAMVSCGGAVMALAALDPEPGSKAVLALAGVLIGFGTCGGSFLGLDKAHDDASDAEAIVRSNQISAEAQFRLLQLQDP
jgi:hypothetical protein